jgi:hypothetical protein
MKTFKEILIEARSWEDMVNEYNKTEKEKQDKYALMDKQLANLFGDMEYNGDGPSTEGLSSFDKEILSKKRSEEAKKEFEKESLDDKVENKIKKYIGKYRGEYVFDLPMTAILRRNAEYYMKQPEERRRLPLTKKSKSRNEQLFAKMGIEAEFRDKLRSFYDGDHENHPDKFPWEIEIEPPKVKPFATIIKKSNPVIET